MLGEEREEIIVLGRNRELNQNEYTHKRIEYMNKSINIIEIVSEYSSISRSHFSRSDIRYKEEIVKYLGFVLCQTNCVKRYIIIFPSNL